MWYFFRDHSGKCGYTGHPDPAHLLINDAFRRIRFAARRELIHFSLLLCPLEATQPVKVELIDHGA